MAKSCDADIEPHKEGYEGKRKEEPVDALNKAAISNWRMSLLRLGAELTSNVACESCVPVSSPLLAI